MSNLRESTGLDVAVVGGGISGIVAAYCLRDRHRVTLYERNDYLGGHTHTIMVPGSEGGPELPVDTGFIVCNDRTYPTFLKFLGQLGVETAPTEMSFSFTDTTRNFCYASTGFGGFFAQRWRLLDPGMWRLLAGIVRFRKRAHADILADSVPNVSLRQYLESIDLPQSAIADHIAPMAGAIWSSAESDALDYPAQSFLRFYRNHGLLSLRKVLQWLYIPGGSHTYVKAFRKVFENAGGTVRLGDPVHSIERHEDRVTLRFVGSEAHHDAVIIATHADEALGMLTDADHAEAQALASWRYARNETHLHTDVSHLPPARRAWACWNARREDGSEPRSPIGVSYWMNRLQRLPAQRDYVVTLNPVSPIAEESRIASMTYTHPGYTFASVASQSALPALNGRGRALFCGSYFGNGFHEDGAVAGAAAATHLGGAL